MPNTTAATIGSKREPVEDPHYHDLLTRWRNRIAQAMREGLIFTTDLPNNVLWSAYIHSIPDEQRQHYTCHACRDFIVRYGALVTVSAGGVIESLCWREEDMAIESPVTRTLASAWSHMRRFVQASAITGPWASAQRDLGDVRDASGWEHLSLTNPVRWDLGAEHAAQWRASRINAFDSIRTAVREWPIETIALATEMVTNGSLNRSEKVEAQARWLHSVASVWRAVKGKDRKDNVIWRAITEAPEGYLHPRTSMIGTLCDDLVANPGDIEGVRARFNAKVQPDRYQRPTADLKPQQIDRANAKVVEMGLEPSFARRYARREELPESAWAWRKPADPVRPVAGFFDGLRPSPVETIRVTNSPSSPIEMSVQKFVRDVLPTAARLSVNVLPVDNFYAITTSANSGAASLWQWGHPFAHYTYTRGSYASQWGLRAGWHEITGITLAPSKWGGEPMEHIEDAYICLISQARAKEEATACLFPEWLRADLRELREVIHAYGTREQVTGADQGNVIGVAITKAALVIATPITKAAHTREIRVTNTDGISTYYRLVVWEA